MNKGIIFSALGLVLILVSLIGLLTTNLQAELMGNVMALILSFVVFALGIMEINAANK